MADELTIGLSIAIGAILTYVIIQSRRKIWYLETMNPRQQYELGKEKKLIVNMVINERQFNGFEAGKYKIILLYGDIATFSKPILHGKIEEMYMQVLAESLIGRKLVSRIEHLRFLDFIFRRIPSLATKAYMVTSELISPQDVLDHCWGDVKERDKALTEMRKRRLIDPKVLWVKPYPPEAKLKEIMAGVLMIPDIVINHEEEYARVTTSQRETLIKIDEGIATLLREVIPWQRNIITSISDPVQVLGMILADRARKLEGLGLEQLAERGGFPSVIQAGKIIKEHWKEFQKIFAEPIKPEELAKAEEKHKDITELKKRVEQLERQLTAKPKAVAT
jgi:hypothetical protein